MTTQEQVDKAFNEGRAYISSKLSDPSSRAYKFKSGLIISIIKRGNGNKFPLPSAQCSCHYEGKIANGAVFDSSYTRDEPVDFSPCQVIPGWSEALQMMREGDKWEVIVPFELGYGARGAGAAIPPFSTLVFTIELIKIKGATKEVSDDVFTRELKKTYADM